MNISGLLVHARPDCSAATRMRLEALDGVQVHAASDEGRLVVTVERSDDGAMTHAFEQISGTEGVLSVALVYHHDEPDEG